MSMVTGDVVARNARLHADQPAFEFEGRVLTHAEFAARAFAFGNALLGLGLERQARVAILSQNRPEYFEVFAGCGAAGLITVSLNWRLAAPELARIIDDCEPQVLVFDAASAPLAAELRSRPGLRHLIALDEGVEGAIDYATLLAGSHAARPAVPVDPADIECLIYTSGTTGVPKGVMLSHRALLEAARILAWDGDARPGDRVLIVMPLFHVGGKIEQMSFWLAGATTVLHRGFDAAAVMRALAEDRVTAAHLAPTMIARMLDEKEARPSAAPYLRVVHYASAPMAVPLLRRAIAAFGPVFLQVYGMTECITVAVLKPHQHVLDAAPTQERRLASAGQPCFGVDVVTRRPDGAPCAVGELGEVAVRGDCLMSGYWSRSAQTLAALRDGWLRTGDIGLLDEGGYLFIVDRLKDMIISGGENIYSREVEDALMSHPAVWDAAVTGAPDPVWGESVRAWIVLREGETVTPEALIEHCRTLIASYKKPRQVAFTPELPRLFNGKVDKKALRTRQDGA